MTSRAYEWGRNALFWLALLVNVAAAALLIAVVAYDFYMALT